MSIVFEMKSGWFDRGAPGLFSPQLRRLQLSFIAGVVLMLPAGCGDDGSSKTNGSRKNVLLITIDTTRADRIGCYGHKKARTPNLDRLASQGVLFSQARATAPLTLPSHASLLSGTYGVHHGVKLNNYRVPERLEMLPERLKEEGYSTGAVVGAIVLDSRFGLDQGFDFYDNVPSSREGKNLGHSQRSASQVGQAARSWLAKQESPFFLWCHFFDPHFPYAPPEELGGPGDDYDREITYVDLEIGRLLSDIDSMSQAQETLIIVVADHGEDLGDHGEMSHGFFLYDSVMRIPLLISLPGELPAGTVVDDDVSGTDLVPTVLELLGLPVGDRCQGKSLLPLLDQDVGKTSHVHLMETYYPELVYGWSRLHAFCENGWKYVEAPRPELYDLRNDPRERENLYDQETDRAQAMKSRLQDLLTKYQAEGDRAQATTIDDDFRQRLESLGYLTPSTTASIETEDRPDPKDMITGHLRAGKAETLFQRGRIKEGLEVLEEILKKDPHSPFLLMMKARKRFEMNDLDGAQATLLQVLSRQSAIPDAYYILGQIEERKGNLKKALREYRRAQVGEGELLEYTFLAAARVLHQMDELQEALDETDRSLAINPVYLAGLHLRGELLLEAENEKDALLTFVRIAELGGKPQGFTSRLRLLFSRAKKEKLVSDAELKELARRALLGLPQSRWLKEMAQSP